MIHPTKYQPILFTQEDSYDCNAGACGAAWDEKAGSWNQKMFEKDYIPFQFEVTPCDNAPNLISNPNFGNSGSGWSVDAGSAQFAPYGAKLLTPGTEISFNPPLNLAQYYYVTISGFIKSIEPAPPISVSLTNVLEDVTFFITEEAQSFSFYVQSTTGKIGIKRNNDIGTVLPTTYPVIDFVTAKPIDLPDISILDLDGVFIESVLTATYEPPYLNLLYTPSQDVIDAGAFLIKVSYACDESPVIVWTSEAIQIIADDNCFIQIGGCGNVNVFQGSFTPFMRLESKLVADRTFTYERFITRRTSGRYRLNYGRASKAFTLSTVAIPEHVRDFIYMLPLCDKIVVKRGQGAQQEYFSDEEPDAPQFIASSDDLASVQLPLVYEQDLIESIYVQECNVSLPPNALGYRPSNLIIKAAENTGIKAD